MAYQYYCILEPNWLQQKAWIKKKPTGNYTRMLRTNLNKSSKQYPTKQLTSNHTNHTIRTNNIYSALLEIQRLIHEWSSTVETWTQQCNPSHKDIHVSAQFMYWSKPSEHIKWFSRERERERELSVLSALFDEDDFIKVIFFSSKAQSIYI